MPETLVSLAGTIVSLVLVLAVLLLGRRAVHRRVSAVFKAAPPAPNPAHRDRWLDEAAALTAAKVGALRPWEPSALADLSTRVDWGSIKFGAFRAAGTIASLSNDGAWVAYCVTCSLPSLVTSELYGTMVARTTAHEWRVEIEDQVARIRLNGTSFGFWRFQDGTLLDAALRPIGTALRTKPSLWQRMSIDQTPVSYSEPPIYSVVLGDKPLGHISTASSVHAAKDPTFTHGRSLVEPFDELEPDDAAWLLAVAVIEHGCHTFAVAD